MPPSLVIPSRLQRRIHRFRLVAYLWVAIVLVLLAQGGTPRWLLAGASYFLLAPFAVAPLQRQWPGRLWPQLLECALTTFAAGLLALPMLPSAAIAGALLSGAVAQFGWRALPPAIVLIVVGGAAGLWLSPLPGHPEHLAADVLSLLFVVAYTTPISALGYEQTMRMHAARSELAAKAARLQQVSALLARYQNPALVQRIERGLAAPSRDPVSAGHDVPPMRLEPRRRWLCVCFVDLAGFTEHAERLAPEDLAFVLNDFLAAISGLVARHGGSVDKFLGDGVLICFGDPESAGRRADALRCLHMTADLAALMRDLNRRWAEHGLVLALAFRAGIACGFCSIGDFGSGERLDYTVIGRPVNLCSRLQDLAGPGEVWVCAATRALVADDWLLEAAGSHRVKGFVAPLAAYRSGERAMAAQDV